jgi:hypothetical protein
MGRVQVLVQLGDDLLSLLDERAAAAGVSCSERVRRGVRAVLASNVESKLDEAIAEGYKRFPSPVPDAPLSAWRPLRSNKNRGSPRRSLVG